MKKIPIDGSSVFDLNDDKKSLDEHNSALQKESNEKLLETKLQEIKKTYKKPGPKGIVVDKRFIDRVYKMSFKGLINNQIYPKFDINHDTWATLKNKYPEIVDAYNKGKDDRIQLALSYNDDILINPKHRNHFNAIKLVLDPWIKENSQPDKVDVNLTNLPSNLSKEELLKLANDNSDD